MRQSDRRVGEHARALSFFLREVTEGLRPKCRWPPPDAVRTGRVAHGARNARRGGAACRGSASVRRCHSGFLNRDVD